MRVFRFIIMDDKTFLTGIVMNLWSYLGVSTFEVPLDGRPARFEVQSHATNSTPKCHWKNSANFGYSASSLIEFIRSTRARCGGCVAPAWTGNAKASSSGIASPSTWSETLGAQLFLGQFVVCYRHVLFTICLRRRLVVFTMPKKLECMEVRRLEVFRRNSLGLPFQSSCSRSSCVSQRRTSPSPFG